MKFILFTIFIMSLSLTVYANDKLGLGVSIGSPIGIHYFYELDGDSRIEGSAGSPLSGGGTNIDAQYVTSIKNKFKLQAYELDFNYGYGAKIRSKNKTSFGPSVLAGVDHEIEGTDFSVLANSGAALLFADQLRLDLNLYLGANYHF